MRLKKRALQNERESMTQPVEGIKEHQGKKYLRKIQSAVSCKQEVEIDVYAILKAFDVTCPARAHAIKKLLCCGNRDKGSALDDLWGVYAAVLRAIQLEEHTKSEIDKYMQVIEKSLQIMGITPRKFIRPDGSKEEISSTKKPSEIKTNVLGSNVKQTTKHPQDFEDASLIIGLDGWPRSLSSTYIVSNYP